MMYKYSPKIVCLLNLEISEMISQEIFNIYSDVANIYVGRRSDEIIYVSELTSDGLQQETVLKNPFTGITIFVVEEHFDGKKIEQITSIWTDAKLDSPRIITISDDYRSHIFTDITRAYILNSENSAKRNVNLLNQIAILRKRCEEYNIVNNELIKLLDQKNQGIHNLLCELIEVDGYIEILKSQNARQRLPITVLPSLIGAISFDIWSDGEGKIEVELYSVEHNCSHQINRFDVIDNIIFVKIENLFRPGQKIIDLIIRNIGEHTLYLNAALQESPEEKLFIESANLKRDAGLLQSMALSVWSPASGTSRMFKGNHTHRQLEPLDDWRNKAEKGTLGFEDRNWLHKRSLGLMIHPLPAAIALAICPIRPRKGRFSGFQLEISLPKESFSIVEIQFIVGLTNLKFSTQSEISNFSKTPPPGFEELYRSEWISIMPGTQKNLIRFWDRPITEAYLYVLNTTNGKPPDFARLTVSDLKLVGNFNDRK